MPDLKSLKPGTNYYLLLFNPTTSIPTPLGPYEGPDEQDAHALLLHDTHPTFSISTMEITLYADHPLPHIEINLHKGEK